MDDIIGILKLMKVGDNVIDFICREYPSKEYLHNALRGGYFRCEYQYLTFESDLEYELRKLK